MTTFLLILACLFLYGIMAGLIYVLCQNWGWLGMDDPVDSGTIAVLWPLVPVVLGFRLVSWLAEEVWDVWESIRR